MTFIRTKENFTCGHCGVAVVGNGYTNHCSACLWSKHVDVEPGDRAATCSGLMRPVKVELVKNETILTHRCEVCGYEKRNRLAKNDNRETLYIVMRNLTEEVSA
jgi:hypothetical protein